MKTMTNNRKWRPLPVAGCRFIVAIATILSVFALFAERQPYERYQSVVDRQMFGQPPAGFDPTKNPSEVSAKDERAKDQELTKEQEQVKSAIHFSMVNVTPAGETAVGFTDNSDSKSPKHYYLKVGESRDGWTVKEADALAATMTIAKGEIEVSLTLGGNSAGGSGTTSRTGGGQKSAANSLGARPRSGSPFGVRGADSASGGPSRGLGSLRERRALREQQRAADAAAAAEEKRIAAEKEAQREAEREAEKAEREKEREEQRAQLLQIQEELRKAREEKEREEAEKPHDGGDEESKGDGE